MFAYSLPLSESTATENAEMELAIRGLPSSMAVVAQEQLWFPQGGPMSFPRLSDLRSKFVHLLDPEAPSNRLAAEGSAVQSKTITCQKIRHIS